MKSFSSTTRSSAAQQGHTLVELLIAISLGSVVLASLGGVLLVSELKVSANIQRNLDAKDAANRAIDLIRREANLSSRIDFGDLDVSASTSPDCRVNTPLILVQRTDDSNQITDTSSSNPRKICYKTIPFNELPTAYPRTLKGPCVLVRLGPGYKPNGDVYDSPDLTPHVLLDGVAGTNECAGGFTADIEPSSNVRRKANMQITLASNVSYEFSVQIPSTLAYEGLNLYRKCKVLDGTSDYCASDSYASHYLTEKSPQKAKWNPRPEAENIFYFLNPYSEYVLSKDSSSGFCSYAECFVKRGDYAVELSKVDALIFPDKEIRPTR